MGSGLTNQVRAYVEYRMFSALSRFGPACSGLSIRLEDNHTAPMKAQYRCSAVVDLLPAARVRARSSGDRLYGTIDTVAERLACAVERRLVKQSIGETAQPETEE
jgi:ribosome-associated translation inhibitor RaiA